MSIEDSYLDRRTAARSDRDRADDLRAVASPARRRTRAAPPRPSRGALADDERATSDGHRGDPGPGRQGGSLGPPRLRPVAAPRLRHRRDGRPGWFAAHVRRRDAGDRGRVVDRRPSAGGRASPPNWPWPRPAPASTTCTYLSWSRSRCPTTSPRAGSWRRPVSPTGARSSTRVFRTCCTAGAPLVPRRPAAEQAAFPKDPAIRNFSRTLLRERHARPNAPPHAPTTPTGGGAGAAHDLADPTARLNQSVPLTRSREARKEHVGSYNGRPRPR